MRIGMMLRAYDEAGGVGVYTRNLVKELLEIDQRNSYVLFYRSEANLGHFADRPNVVEKLVRAPNKALWDQLSIPFHCWREKLDIVVHPKFTVPLLAPCKAVMVVHGADWFMPDQAVFYGKWDVRYVRAVMPSYFRKADVVLSVSKLTADNFYSVLDLPDDKIRTVYFGPAKHFARVLEQDRLETVKVKYALPDHFIFTLTKRGGGGRKNLRQLLEAYARYHRMTEAPFPLVIGGKDCRLFRDDYDVFKTAVGEDIHFPGYLDQADLPAVYSQAELYFYPSNLEAFPIPLTEAMACGTPMITSDVNGLREIAGDAAVFVDPTDAEGMAEALSRVLSDEVLRAQLSRRSLERSKVFDWEKCARETLEILENLGAEAKPPKAERLVL